MTHLRDARLSFVSGRRLHACRTLLRYLEDDFKFDGRTERKACNAVDQSARIPFFPKDTLQQFGRAVSTF
jgi:hypothetical protein